MASRRGVLVRLLVGAAILAVLAVLFLQTLRETTTAPYFVRAGELGGWELMLDPPLGPRGPLLTLTPPRELPMALFQQVFERTMESMSAPTGYMVTVIARDEYDGILAGLFEPAELLALAEAAGLERAAPTPRCLAIQSAPGGGQTARMFFALFDLPELGAFRETVGRLLAERGGDPAAFDPSAAVPAIYLAATERGFRGWPAPDVDAERHCAAPIELAPAG